MNRDSYPVVFQYDPFVGVYECFKELFPDKDAEIWWQYDLTDGDGGKVLGVTTFPDDGSLPQIMIDCDQYEGAKEAHDIDLIHRDSILYATENATDIVPATEGGKE